MNPVQTFFNKTENYLHRRFEIKLRIELVSHLLGDLVNKKILDAGCGDGSLSLSYLEKNQVVFCDVAENMLELVKRQIPEKFRSSATLYNGTLEQYPVSDQFDVILCIGVLAHVDSVENTIERLSGLIKVKGLLVLQFSDAGHWLTRFNLKNSNYGYKLNTIYYKDLLKTCKDYGFILKREVRYHFLLPGMGRFPDKFLFKFQKTIMKYRFLSMLCTDYILVMEKN
jgi:2-polyprenyl-3-methyl-5-hydroxy-6-metoxy-1,4-benzoquinol methylase